MVYIKHYAKKSDLNIFKNHFCTYAGFRLPSGKWLGLIEAWKNISHTNLIQLREIFTTKAFGDTCEYNKFLKT